MACQSPDVCSNESVDENHSFLDMELEALQSIYINELEVKENENYTTVSIHLYPSTADKLDEQYVRMTLQFTLDEEYPEKIPRIKIRNPRGLSDEKLSSIIQDLLGIAESKKGSSMLFEMIDAAKEHLTVGNRPSGECAICLHGFSDNDVFTKTECYHYFHSHCLARYVKNVVENLNGTETDVENKSKNNELLCPMCRIPIEFNGLNVEYPPPEECGENNFILSEEMIELQKKMAALYQKQVEKGGIIDVEAEKNKYLLEISNVPTRLSSEEKSDQKLVLEDDAITDCKVEETDEIDSPASERKELVKDHNKRFDYRGRNRNFNRPNESRNNYRYDYRYNKPSYDNYRGNYNRYGKQRSENSYRHREESEIPNEKSKDSSVSQDLLKNEDSIGSQEMLDNASETSEHLSPSSRSRYNSNFSPRYNNRGYRYGGSNYGNYNSHRRSDQYGYHERRSQTSHRYSAMRGEESSPSKFEDRAEHDHRTYEDDHKTNYRSGNYRRDDDYHGKQRYSDNRGNSHRGFKGAYGRRDNYSNPNNSYSRNNRYGDSKDREQYTERNYREKRTYRDDRYKSNGDFPRYKQGARNYTGSRPRRYSDRSYADSSNNEYESAELKSLNHNSISYPLSTENESLGDSSAQLDSSVREDSSLNKKDAADFKEQISNKSTDVVSGSEDNASNVLSENSHVIPRTVNPPPGFANPLKKVIYGLQGANPPPGFNRS